MNLYTFLSYRFSVCIIFLCGFSVALSEARSPKCCKSHTIFIPRQVTFDATFEDALNFYDIYHGRFKNNCESESGEYCTRFAVMPFYQQSTKAQHIARYLLPSGHSQIALKEDGTGDVNSLWLNLISPQGTSYNSVVSLCPRRRTVGAVFNGYFDLAGIYDGLWLTFNTTAMQVETNLRLREIGGGNGTLVGFKNACDAFNNPQFTAGKLACCKLKKSGLDDIQIKLGYNYFYCERDHIAPYLVIGIPTGQGPKAKYLFEPLIGSVHASVGGGVNGDYTLWTCDNQNVVWMADIKYRYVFAAQEHRTFDLTNGDWTRFLLLVAPNTTTDCLLNPPPTVPAVNVLTKDTRVTPGSTIDFWTAFNYAYCSWNIEVGYNLWWKAAEKLKLCNTNLGGLGILDISQVPALLSLNDPTPVSITTASKANISQGVTGSNAAPSDGTFIPLTISQIDVCSAAHPRAISNKVYLGASYDFDWCNRPSMVGLSASYEAGGCAALSQWAIWASLAISF